MKVFLPSKYKFLFFVFLLLMSFSINMAYGQIDSSRVQIPHPIQQNAGFDVIVKLNGDLVYGLVKEVGPYYISYQRTDIPDGPIYTIPRNEVYVISYRNQVKDYINGRTIGPSIQDSIPTVKTENISKNNGGINFENGNLHLALGFLRSFSKLKNVNNYSTSATFPVVSVAYEVNYKSNLQLGLMLGFGSHKFSDQNYSTYDSTNNNINITENIFGLYVYGRYYFLNGSSRLQPYILAGPGITSSNIHSENKISFTNDNSQIILVKSGTRTTGVSLMARAGAQYFVTDQFRVSLDAGVGLSVIKLGISFALK
ncbi:MAG: outer membrane beta-barrel protein [Bacteroidota bacterium]|nr:outer membrane beta-barrel protein [Bacteroidota bacterium]